ncbi:alpha/beta hydrolase [Arthrobacter sp. AL08]|uniref:alpha/beta fold hydrolase n=1 Tax=unclassified Arthrobacter TaxID=235627 RepID=UPI00249B6480|nr:MULTISPECIES: alpha/beta hydrolase [unclassified Arthrobacter]MDI3243143.1 alpha/beta hydrolase [Arthrobacter sp. AL05]MDI3279153.1 alpha/beta hydrolase [Arthrobacter sp. AL08]
MPELTETMIATNGTRLNVAISGEGAPIVLLHGFPHTWKVWFKMIPTLAEKHRVIAPDLRGLGASDRPTSGYDARNIASDIRGLLDALDEGAATVVALDAAVPPAFMLGLEHPHRVTQLALMEGTIGRLPGAEGFFRAGAPWWFGFHAVPGLAEEVLLGHEPSYIDFFLHSGTARGRGVGDSLRDEFVAAYTGREALRAAFEHYRVMPINADQIAKAISSARLRVPTIAIGGGVVGPALAGQLEAVTDDLRSNLLPDVGHIIPLDAPEALLNILAPALIS